MFPPLLLVAAVSTAPSHAGTLGDPAVPLVTLPLLRTPPGSPRLAFEGGIPLGPMVALGSRAPVPGYSINLLRTGEALVVVAHVRLGPDSQARAKATHTEHDSALWDDDAVEVFVDPGHTHQTYYQFIVNAAGAKWESRGQDPAWDAAWEAEAGTAPDWWSARITIPFAALGGAPHEGDVWGLNVGVDRQTPSHQLASWADLTQGFHEPANFGHVLFADGAPRTGVMELGLEGGAILGRAAVPGGGRVLPELSVRPAGEGQEPLPVHAVPGEPAPDAETIQYAAQAELPRAGAFVRPGTYVARLSARDANGQVLLNAPAEFPVAAPVTVALKRYFLAGRVEATVDASGLGAQAQGASLNLRLLAPDGKSAFDHAFTGVPVQPAKVDIPTADLAPGAYSLEARAVGPNGEVLYVTDAPLEVPARPAWLGSQEGLSDRVLAPWTPLQVKGQAVLPWGRRYQFGALPFPEQIEAAGAELLAGPIRLEATVNGTAQTWTGTPARVTTRGEAAVELAADARGTGLQLTGTTRIEYDGMMRADFALTAAQDVTVERLDFVIPLKATHATYLYHYPGQWGNAYNAGALPPDGFVAAFRPFFWLGDEERGLAWFSESDRGFAVQDPNQVTDIRREGEVVNARVHIINTPTTLTAGQPLTYTFGLQATPVRENKEDVWDFRICHAGNYGIEDQLVNLSATLEYSARGLINEPQGTVEMWVRPHFNCDPTVAADDQQRGALNRDLVNVIAGDNQVGFYWNIDDRGMRVYLRRGAEYPALIGGRAPMKEGQWSHVAFTWGDRLRVYVDGQVTAEVAHQGLFPADWESGRIVLGSGISQFDVDEIRVSDEAREPAAMAGGPCEPDEHTRLLDHLDETFTPDGRHRTSGIVGRASSPAGEAGGGTPALQGGLPGAGGEFTEGRFGRAFTLWQPGPPTTVVDRLAQLGVRTIVFHEHWTDIQDWADPATVTLGPNGPVVDPNGHADQLRKLVKACHDHGLRLLLYYGYEMSNIAPEWPLYSDECLVAPLAGGYHRLPEQNDYIVCYRSPWQDYVAAAIAHMMDAYDIDGVYLDGTANPWGCANTGHGCGYERPDGTVGTTYTFFATREMMRRIYTIVKSRKPEGLVNVHQSTCMTIPSLAWATSYWDGEQFGGIAAGPFALDVLPLDAFRCEFMGRQWGVPSELLCYEQPYTYSQATAISLPHDVLVRGSLGGSLELESKLWAAMDDFGRKQAEWHPYWSNADLVSVRPQNAKVSLYVRPGKGCLAVVSDLGTRGGSVSVRFDLAALGLPADTTAADALTGDALPLERGGLSLEMDPLTFRVVRLGRWPGSGPLSLAEGEGRGEGGLPVARVAGPSGAGDPSPGAARRPLPRKRGRGMNRPCPQ